MTSLRVIREPCGWALQIGHGLAGLYPSRLHAVEQARWLAGQFIRQGEDAEVIIEPIKGSPRLAS